MDPREVIDQSSMTRLQITAVVLCIVLNALDGFDVLSIAFAAPGISSEWGIDRAALGVVLSMELIGMGIGSVIMGRFADNYGRRVTIIGCLCVMTIGMLLAALANGVTDMSVYRFVTGLGIGGMLASTNALVAEYSNLKQRAMMIMFMVGGYPLGIVIGGAFASYLLELYDWRSIFYFGAVVTGVMVIAVWFLLPESIHYLISKRSPGAVDEVNKLLRKMGRDIIDSLPASTTQSKETTNSLFSTAYGRSTLVLTLAYFFHMMAFYFFLKWVPKLVVDMGFSPSEAGSVLVWANVGSVIGCILIGFLSHRIPVKTIGIGLLFASAVVVGVYGRGYEELLSLSMIAAAAGFLTNGAITCLYSLFAAVYPTELRASGTGFVIGLGRAGAALGPIVAGMLFAASFGLQSVAILMGAGCAIAAFAVLFLRRSDLSFGR